MAHSTENNEKYDFNSCSPSFLSQHLALNDAILLSYPRTNFTMGYKYVST
jgi:hypothetical protein